MIFIVSVREIYAGAAVSQVAAVMMIIVVD